MKLKVFSHYIKVWLVIVKASFRRSYVYRTEVFVRFLRTFFILGVQILLLNAVFGDNEIYVGWTKSEAYLVMGIWNFLNYMGWSLFGVNLFNLENKVIKGEFDFYLLKPISSAWFASFCDFFIYNFVTVLSGLSLIGWYIYQEWGNLEYTNILLGVVAIFIALILWYGLYLLFASFTISNPRNGYLVVAKELLGITKYPIDIFGNTFQIFFYTLLPIAFLTTVPAKTFMGEGSYIVLLCGLLVGIATVIIGKNIWNRNIRNYVSSGG